MQLIKEMTDSEGHNECVSKVYFCPNCYTKIDKESPLFDTYQEKYVSLQDGIEERKCPVDYLQNRHNKSHLKMGYNLERRPKLNPYMILHTDPTLVNLKSPTKSSNHVHCIGKSFSKQFLILKCFHKLILIYNETK